MILRNNLRLAFLRKCILAKASLNQLRQYKESEISQPKSPVIQTTIKKTSATKTKKDSATASARKSAKKGLSAHLERKEGKRKENHLKTLFNQNNKKIKQIKGKKQ